QDGAVMKTRAALAGVGDGVELGDVGHVSAENEHLAHGMLISNAKPVQLREIFSASTYGEVSFSARGADTVVWVSNTLDNVYTGHLLARLSNETGSSATLRRSEFVGPQIGEELRAEGGLGILCALFMVMLSV